MSSSPSPLSLISRARGRSLTEIIVSGVGGWLLALSVAAISGLQAVFEFLFLPFELFIRIATESVKNLILVPMGIVPKGAEITGQEIVFFDFLALPASVALTLFTFIIIIVFLMLGITSNVFPGLVVDNRIVEFFFTTPEEEEEGED